MEIFEHHANCLRLRLYVQPKASQDKIIGIHGNALKVSITAAPTDGKANAHLIAYIAKLCKIAKSQICVAQGHSSRHKIIEIQDIPHVPQALACWLPADR